MKPDGSRLPLFLIHSLDGDVLIYRDLVRRLAPEQPAWGLETIGGDGRQLPNLAIPDMARHYIAEIRTVQPHGPYYLAGLCYGGDVAYEMAHQLEAAGEHVAFVGLIDAKPLGLRPRVTTPQRIRQHVHELFELPVAGRSTFLRETSRNAWCRLHAATRWSVKKHLYIARRRPLPTRIVDLTELNVAAADGYVSPRYGGRVTLFRVYNPDAGEHNGDPRLRWDEFAGGGLDVRDIVSNGAEHIRVLYEPHVRALATALEQAIRETLTGSAG